MKKFEALIIYPDARPNEVKILETERRVPSFEQLQAFITPIIGTSWMEHVSVLHANKQRDMFVDENGRMTGLPLNREATEIYLEASRRHKLPIDGNAIIVGIAVIFKERVWF